MSEKKLTVAIAGLGSRGNAYASCCKLMSDKVEIVACAEIIPDRLERFAKEYSVPAEGCFNSAEEMLAAGKLADVLFICTMDREHYCFAIPALKMGYHLVLEKPASPVPAECREIAKVAKEMDRQVIVCHVLRYTPFYRKVKEVIDSGVLGKVLAIQANEQVGWWHQAHSFVRGNWRNSDETSPMLLQKCCHDMDILLWLTGKHAVSVSSFGSLSHFKSSEAPEGATERCDTCPHFDTCQYSTKEIYLRRAEAGQFGWPVDVVEAEEDIEKLRETLKTSPYGKCVYYCDNNVVDHQVVNLLLEDDLMISFNMCAFTAQGGRRIHIMGTKGDLTAHMEDSKMTVTVYGQEPQIVDSGAEVDQFGHGGGDYVLVKDMIDLMNGELQGAGSSIDDSIESHLVCLAAEKSRLAGGELVKMADFVG